MKWSRIARTEKNLSQGDTILSSMTVAPLLLDVVGQSSVYRWPGRVMVSWGDRQPLPHAVSPLLGLWLSLLCSSRKVLGGICSSVGPKFLAMPFACRIFYSKTYSMGREDLQAMETRLCDHFYMPLADF